MKTRTKNTIQLILFLIIAAAAVFYVINKSPLESRDDFYEYEKKHSSSSPASQQTDSPDKETEGDEVSLTGKEGRYGEAIIGRKE